MRMSCGQFYDVVSQPLGLVQQCQCWNGGVGCLVQTCPVQDVTTAQHNPKELSCQTGVEPRVCCFPCLCRQGGGGDPLKAAARLCLNLYTDLISHIFQ